jgi:cyclopropane-fatty-acyl-phospholipid synthase
MDTPKGPGSDAARITLGLLDDLIGRENDGRVGVRLWDGTPWPDDRPREATLVLRHPGALRVMFRAGTELALSEAYLYDDFDIEGDIFAVHGLADALAKRTSGAKRAYSWTRKLAAVTALGRLPKEGRRPRTTSREPARLAGHRHTPERDREAIRFHYDVSSDFYRIFLDSRMVYSCGYFADAATGLEAAQLAKLDLICRKLRLKPGQRLLDIGCGWGGLVMHAARAYGVDATGITLSRPQMELAAGRIEAAALAKTCRVHHLDYREVPEDRPWDALVSVGMFEHVGGEMLGTYFRKAARLLTEGGTFLNHGIASRVTDTSAKGPNFNDSYVFPDTETPPIHVSLRAAEESGFEVRDVESLREHYALTLRHWVRRLEAGHDEALRYVDEPTYRVWRLYLSGSAHGFTTGRLNVYQALLALPEPGGASGLPLTREDWYRR